jgi:hypothetical protein
MATDEMEPVFRMSSVGMMSEHSDDPDLVFPKELLTRLHHSKPAALGAGFWGAFLSSLQLPSGGLIPSRSIYNRHTILISHGNSAAEARTARRPARRRQHPEAAALPEHHLPRGLDDLLRRDDHRCVLQPVPPIAQH